MLRHGFLVLSGAITVLVVCACTGDEMGTPQPNEGTQLPQATVSPATSGWTTEPAALPVHEDEPVRIWVYMGLAPGISVPCSQLFDVMVSLPYRDEVNREPAECTPDITSQTRAEYRLDPDGIFFLANVRLLLLGSSNLPDLRYAVECEEIEQYLLPVKEHPEVPELEFPEIRALECTRAPRPPQIVGATGIELWGAVAVSTPALAIPDGVRCVALLKYLGPPRGAPTRPQACILD